MTHRFEVTDQSFMFNIVLIHPEIPPNTGNIIRLAANTGCHLHLIEPLAFSMDDKSMRRAGLDYHEYANVKRHSHWQRFLSEEQPDTARMFGMSTHATHSLQHASFTPGDWLVFGSETKGMPTEIRESFLAQRLLRLPMRPGQRSLNLSNAVAVVVYEAWRQQGYAMPDA